MDTETEKSASQAALDKAFSGSNGVLTTSQFLEVAIVMAIRELTIEVMKLGLKE